MVNGELLMGRIVLNNRNLLKFVEIARNWLRSQEINLFESFHFMILKKINFKNFNQFPSISISTILDHQPFTINN